MAVGRALLFLAVLLMAATAAAQARADGTVVRATGCGGKIFVSSLSGYSVLTVEGTPGIADEDALVGKVDGVGYTRLYDRTRGVNFSAIVEDHRLSRDDVMPRIAAACRSALENDLATGTVVRSEGCGNRIFVSAEQGFAILDRLAGGMVGKDDTLSGDFNKPGRATVEDKQTGSVLTVFVEDYQLSRAAADRKMDALCAASR